MCLKGVYTKIYGIAMLYCVWNIQFDFYQKICLHNDIRSSDPPPSFPLYIYPSTLTSWPRLYAEITICSTFYTRDTFAQLPGTCYGENNNYLSHWELFLLLEGQCTLKLISPPQTYKTLGLMGVSLSTLKHIEPTTLCSWLVCSRPRSPRFVFHTMSILPMSVTPFMTLFCFMTSGLGTKQ